MRKAYESIKVGEWGTKILGLKICWKNFPQSPQAATVIKLTGENTELMVLLLCLKN